MEACKSQSKLFVYSSVDYRDEEEKYERAHQYVQQQIAGLSDKELHDILNQLVNKEKPHEEICIGLLYIILTDEQLAPKTYRDLTLISRDGLQLVLSNINMLLVEKYSKLSEIGRRQLLWLVRELIKNQVQNVENIVWNCLRQTSGGDISPRNLYLVEGLLDIFIEQRQWLEKNSFYVCLVVYTYVRLLEDHCSNNPAIVNLRNKEIKFVISLIRDRFVDIISLGRDFVRLLQNVSRIPEFSMLWRDMLLNPKSLSPSFTGVWQLLQIRTSRRYLQSRLTPEIERKLHFLTSNVKFGNHKRYQDWFQEKYFNTPESHSLRSDLIRFIINVIHPTNDMLCSDIIPRWAIIGWLLTSCTNPVAQSNAKLALFYDWLFFDPTKDNIMNVEPGILVMYHSIRNHPLVSSTLLDFLCRIIKNFLPKNEDKIRAGVYNSLRKILEKQVITNLHPLFESPKLDKELKILIRDNFREFCSISSSSTILPAMGQPPILNDADFRNNSLHPSVQHIQLSPEEIKILQQQQQQGHLHHPQPFPQPPLQNHNNNILSGIDHQLRAEMENNSNGSLTVNNDGTGTGTAIAIQKEENENEPEAVFSDDETDPDVYNKNEELTDDDDDLPLSKVRLKEKPTVDKVDLPSSISESFEKYITTKTTQTFDSFLNDFRSLSPSALNSEQQLYVYTQTVQVLKQTMPKNKFPESKSDEKLLAESISCPLYSICRTMYQYEDKLKKSFQNFLTYIYKKIPDLGHMLLYFLKVHSKLQSRKNTNQSYIYKSSLYKLLCEIGNDDTNNINGNNNNEDDDEDEGDNEKCTGSELIIKCLIKDLTNLEAENTHIFLWLIPDIFREFKTNVINNSEIIRIILSCIDARHLRDFVYNVTQGKLQLFKNDGILGCLRDSLEYETFEQYCLWQLVQAHDVPIEVIQKLLPELESSKHAEALTSLLFLLKHEKPTTELIRLLLSRETRSRGDSFVTSALRFWCTDSEEILSEIVANLLMSKYPNSSPNKRKRPAKNQSAINSTPSADQLLNHLEHFRRSCRHGNGTGTGLYVQDQMQNALQQAYSHSSDSIKKQYSDLFALAAEDETSGISRRGGTGRGRKQPNSKKDTNSSHNTNKKNFESVNNYSSEGESSDDEWAKPKQSKRRKKALSDSD